MTASAPRENSTRWSSAGSRPTGRRGGRRLEAAGRLLHRGRHLRLELRPEGRLHGHRPRRDPRHRARPGDGRPRGVAVPVPGDPHRREAAARSSASGSRSSTDGDGTRRRDVRHRRQLVPARRTNFKMAWQRDFFDFGNVAALFMEMIEVRRPLRRACRSASSGPSPGRSARLLPARRGARRHLVAPAQAVAWGPVTWLTRASSLTSGL